MLAGQARAADPTPRASRGCVDTQTLDSYSITPAEAHQLAWEAFRRCVHVIADFGEQAQLVAGE